MNVFTVTFDTFNSFLLNININYLSRIKKIKKSY